MNRRERRRTMRRLSRAGGFLDPGRRDLPPDAWITQMGTIGGFKDQPRWERQPPEIYLSMTSGRVEDVTTASLIVWGRRATKRDVVRHLLVEEVISAGYDCWLDGTVRNPMHVSIGPPLGAVEGHDYRAWWTAAGRATLTEIAERSERRHRNEEQG